MKKIVLGIIVGGLLSGHSESLKALGDYCCCCFDGQGNYLGTAYPVPGNIDDAWGEPRDSDIDHGCSRYTSSSGYTAKPTFCSIGSCPVINKNQSTSGGAPAGPNNQTCSQ